ncbi:MAG: radical SAM protein [Candidatus Sulfotelmatobacter sp.]
MVATHEPFLTPVKKRWIPPEMTTAPALDPNEPANMIDPHYALLINPFYAKDANASFGKHVLTPTLALTSFAATTPAHWRIEYWDENLLDGRPPFRPMPQVVGITVHLTFARRAYELADWYRARGTKVIFGGLHVLSCPDECEPHADALALGDGVQLWPRILRDIENNSLQPRYVATYENDYCDDPPPRRSILPRHSFLTTTSLIATRGCHNRCGFCYLATDGLRMPYRMKRPEQIASEFQENGEPYAVFIDNNLGSRRDYLYALCAALRPINKIWSAAVTIDVTDDPSLIRHMALAGCTGVFVGFESLSDDNLADAHKKTPKTSDYARRVRMLHDYGIQVNGSFVLGFDHDRKDVFARTADWIEENRLECATFHILTPYPATPLFQQMEAQGRILHRDWTLYDTGHAVFQPKHMTPEDLEHGYAWIYQRLFSHSSIWRRRPQDSQSVPLYLAMSYLYKRSNRFWHLLIKHDLVNPVWKPLVEMTRWRHVMYRKRLAEQTAPVSTPGQIVSAGV